MRLLILIGLLISNLAFAADKFSISSSAFSNNKTIPLKYTCDHENLSPPLTWNSAPKKTASYALIVSDPDAPAGVWYHWVVYNIPKETSSLKENMFPTGSSMGKNSWGNEKYNGPCPPPGKLHHYVFTLYALDENLSFTSTPDAEKIIAAMQGHVLKTAVITGVFERQLTQGTLHKSIMLVKKIIE